MDKKSDESLYGQKKSNFNKTIQNNGFYSERILPKLDEKIDIIPPNQ